MIYKNILALVAIFGVYGLVKCAPMNLTTVESEENGTEEEITDNELQGMSALRFKRSANTLKQKLCRGKSDIRSSALDLIAAVDGSIDHYRTVLTHRHGWCNLTTDEVTTSESELEVPTVVNEVSLQDYVDDIIERSQEYRELLNNVSAFEIGFVCRHNKSIELNRRFARCRTKSPEQLLLEQTEQKKACVTIKENQFIRSRIQSLIGKIKKMLGQTISSADDMIPVDVTSLTDRYGNRDKEFELRANTIQHFKNVRRHAENVRRLLSAIC